MTGKYSVDVTNGHTIAIGVNGQYTERSENRLQTETSPIGYPTVSFDQSYDATVKRLALFAQDEWSVTDRLSAYVGLRWEGLHTETEGAAEAPVGNKSSVASPTLQIIWKIPDTKADQVRVSLGRTYKAPTAKDLIPRLWQVADNTATTPNFRGNPDLRPELSWGLDVGYERYLPGDGVIGLSAYARRIDNVILRNLFQEDGMWINTPRNSGTANVAGVELEVKSKLTAMIKNAPDIEFRFGANANWSKVANVPGPNNRLNQQVPFSASTGIDYRPGSLPLTFGANYAFERGATTRMSVTESSATVNRATADMYALWKLDKQTRLRISLNNTKGRDNGLQNRYFDNIYEQNQRITAPDVRMIRVLLERTLQ